jgi:hypothetical protein
MTIWVASGSVVTDVRGDTLHLQAESIRSAGGRSERWD